MPLPLEGSSRPTYALYTSRPHSRVKEDRYWTLNSEPNPWPNIQHHRLIQGSVPTQHNTTQNMSHNAALLSTYCTLKANSSHKKTRSLVEQSTTNTLNSACSTMITGLWDNHQTGAPSLETKGPICRFKDCSSLCSTYDVGHYSLDNTRK